MGSHARPDWTPEEISLLKELCESGLYRFDKLAEKMGRSRHGVMYKCYEQGFQNRYRYHLYTHDKAFFSKVTPETCYWAGCITTDGCLSYHKGSATLALHVAVKDKDHAERFRTAIRATNPIFTRNGKCAISTKDPEAIFVHCEFAIHKAEECFHHLSQTFNITPNTTLRGNPPNLSTLYHRLCFIRGFIDGDGTITISNQEGLMSFSICGCNREMISWIKDTIDSMNLPHLTNGARHSLVYQSSGENCYYYQVRGLRAAILWEILQRLPLPRLSRKWDNPKLIPHLEFWKNRTDVWPSEIFFQQYTESALVKDVTLSPTVTSIPIPSLPPPESVYPVAHSIH